MSLRRFLLLLWVGCAFAYPAHAAPSIITEHVVATLAVDTKAIEVRKPFWALVHLKMKPGWHTYWRNPGDSGVPITLNWSLPSGFTASDIHWQTPERQQVGPLVDYGYSKDAYYLTQITPPAILEATANINVEAKYLVCNEVCVPEIANLSLIVPSGKSEKNESSELIDRLVDAVPKTLEATLDYSVNDKTIYFSFPKREEIESAQFFPQTENFIVNSAEQKIRIMPGIENNLGWVGFTLAQEGVAPAEADGIIALVLNNGKHRDYVVHLHLKQVAVTPVTKPVISPETLTLPFAIALAFVGGLLLNLMPCVFPILSFKALAIAKKAHHHKREIRRQALAYTAGVILSFIALAGMLLILRTGGQAIGWGYQLQSPVFVAALIYVLFLVGLNLSGYFELPVLLGTVGHKTTAEDNAAASFLTGALAVLVATPCTAPLMAPAIGFALTQNPLTTLFIFVALGLGLALPFLLLGFFPRMIALLPKPGVWMVRFKQILAFPVYLTVAWLLWVLTRQTGADALGIVMVSMIVVAFALWLEQLRLKVWRIVGWVLLLVTLMVSLNHIYAMPRIESAHALHARMFSMGKLNGLRNQGSAVFVDVTADWCITCKINEHGALASADVKKLFEEQNIHVLVADWTNGDSEITKYLESFGRSGVPLYVYYPLHGEPKVLPQLLTKSNIAEALQP